MNDFPIKKGLVSLLTPCYNGGKFIHRLLDSVLIQDYPHIEMVVVDDGSTDDTRQKVEEYIPKFTQRGYSLNYLHKENGGQASAINMGLPLLRGEFIAWPDSDDYYSSSKSISFFVTTFQKENANVGIVRTIARFIEDGTGDILNIQQENLPEGQIFVSMLRGKYPLTPNSYMIRAEALNKAIPNRHIFDGKRPQNIQMFTPVTYLYEVKNTKAGLVTILVREDSDSHIEKESEEQLATFDDWIVIYKQTLDNMPYLHSKEKKKYKQIATSVILNDELALCFHQLNKEMARNVAQKMRQEKVSMHWKKRIKYAMLMTCPRLLDKIQ